MSGLGLVAIIAAVGLVALALLKRDRRRTLGRVDLLRAIEDAAHGGVACADVQDIAEATLRPLAQVFSPVDGLFALWTLDPAREGRVEGFAPVRWKPVTWPAEVVRWLLSGEGVVRVSDLATRIVREPALRPIHAFFAREGIALVAPAVCDGETQGALVVPAPLGRIPIDDGIVDAFGQAARWLAPQLAHASAQTRAAERETAWYVERRGLVVELDRQRARAREASGIVRPTFVARSSAMQSLLGEVDRAAAAPEPVLVIGALGSGAERVARALHAAGARADGPFVVREARRLRSSEIDPEGPAMGGTLFVKDLPALPPGLLEPMAVAIAAAGYRLIASSRIEAGEMEDRIVEAFPIRLKMPSLSERKDDLPELAAQRLRAISAALAKPDLHLAPGAIDVLLRHTWPGNVPELDLVLSDAATRAKSGRIEGADLRLLVAPASVAKRAKDPRPS